MSWAAHRGDESALLRLIDEVYAAALAPAGFASFVGSLRRQLDAAYMGFVSKSFNAAPTLTDGADHSWLEAYRSHFSRVDPYCSRVAARLKVGELCAIDSLVPRKELLATEFHADFLSHMALCDGLVGVVDRNDTALGVITLLFSRSLASEGQAELAFLSRLMPHIQRSLEICRIVSEAHAESRFGRHLLEELACAAFVVTPSGTLLRANAAAESLLARADGIVHGREGLAASHPDDNRLMRREIAQALPLRSASACRRILRLRRRSHPQPLLVTVGPLTSRTADPLGLPCERVLVLVRDAEHQPSIAPRALGRALGLTPGEAKVVALLVEGSSIEEIAERLAIAPATVRSHVKAAFAKTGTHRQAELVKLALLAVPSVPAQRR